MQGGEFPGHALADEGVDAGRGGEHEGVVVVDDDVGRSEVVAAAVAVVGPARQPAVVERGEPAARPGQGVVDVAAVDRFVAARGVLAVAVADRDQPAQRPGQGALARHAGRGDAVTEEGALDVGGAEVGEQSLGADDGAVGQLAQPPE